VERKSHPLINLIMKKNDCSLYIIECLGKENFCDWKGARNQLQDHLKQCQFQMFAPIVNAFKAQIVLQQKLIDSLKTQHQQQIDSLNEQIQQQHNEISLLKTHNQQIDSLKVHAQLEKELNSLNKKMEEQSIENQRNFNEIDMLTIPNADIFTPGQNITLSNDNKKATQTGLVYGHCNILGNKQVSCGLHQWTVKLVKMRMEIIIGIAPFDVNKNQANLYGSCGWYLYCNKSTLYSGPPMNFSNKAYSDTALTQGSTITVKLDIDKKTISYVINGTDYGIAYQDILTDKKLSLCVVLYAPNDCVELV